MHRPQALLSPEVAPEEGKRSLGRLETAGALSCWSALGATWFYLVAHQHCSTERSVGCSGWIRTCETKNLLIQGCPHACTNMPKCIRVATHSLAFCGHEQSSSLDRPCYRKTPNSRIPFFGRAPEATPLNREQAEKSGTSRISLFSTYVVVAVIGATHFGVLLQVETESST